MGNDEGLFSEKVVKKKCLKYILLPDRRRIFPFHISHFTFYISLFTFHLSFH